jgi:hypothetical protein
MTGSASLLQAEIRRPPSSPTDPMAWSCMIVAVCFTNKVEEGGIHLLHKLQQFERNDSTLRGLQ